MKDGVDPMGWRFGGPKYRDCGKGINHTVLRPLQLLRFVLDEQFLRFPGFLGLEARSSFILISPKPCQSGHYLYGSPPAPPSLDRQPHHI